MKFMLRRERDRLTVNLNGRLDEEAAGQLRDKLLALDVSPFRRVDMDIAGVSFIGSAGIAKLLLLHNHLASQKSALCLVKVPSHIFELFQSMRLDKVFCMQRS